LIITNKKPLSSNLFVQEENPVEAGRQRIQQRIARLEAGHTKKDFNKVHRDVLLLTSRMDLDELIDYLDRIEHKF
jgi:hypothetical protein